MKLTPYLNFDGNCAEAMAFYAELFGGKVVYQLTYAEMPMEDGMPPIADQHRQKICHAAMEADGLSLFGADVLPEFCTNGAYLKPQGISVHIGVPSMEEGRRIFDALAEGGQINMPFGPTSWSTGFGSVTDRFGNPWLVDVMENS